MFLEGKHKTQNKLELTAQFATFRIWSRNATGMLAL